MKLSFKPKKWKRKELENRRLRGGESYRGFTIRDLGSTNAYSDWPKELQEKYREESNKAEKKFLDKYYPLPDPPIPMTEKNLAKAFKLYDMHFGEYQLDAFEAGLIARTLDKEKYTEMVLNCEFLRWEIEEKYEQIYLQGLNNKITFDI